MRHRKKGRKLGRIKSQRVALLKTLLGSLIMREKIETTQARAKELKSKIDGIINKAKKGKSSSNKFLVFRQLEKIIPQNAAKKLAGNFLNRFSVRNSGYTRIIKLNPRKSDAAKKSIIEFVD